MESRLLILYTRDGCHLCERLKKLVMPTLAARGVRLIERNIIDGPDWYEAYWSRIPVLMLGDRVLLEGNPPEAEVQRVISDLFNS